MKDFVLHAGRSVFDGARVDVDPYVAPELVHEAELVVENGATALDGPRVVGHGIDAMTLAYRVGFPEPVLHALKTSSEVAKRYGKSEFHFGEVHGLLQFSRVDRAWLVVGPRFRVRFVLNAPGAQNDTEPGWTFELVWAAAALRKMSPATVRRASKRIAASCGRIYQKRLRRIDLYADIAGWKVEQDDGERFVRRPRSRFDANAFTDREILRFAESGDMDPTLDEAHIVTHHRARVTGFSFCPGSALMARVYDKIAELHLKMIHIRAKEEAVWRANGWNGTDPVTRVEFQIRGEAVKEFGLRDPDAPTQDARVDGKLVTLRTFEGFENAIDRVWLYCVDWLRLTAPRPFGPVEDPKRAARRQLDDKWTELTRLVFVDKADASHERVQRRGGASLEQTLGCVLSTLAQANQLDRWWVVGEVMRVEELEIKVGVMLDRFRGVLVRGLTKKWGRHEALDYLIQTNNAVRAREFDEFAGVGLCDRDVEHGWPPLAESA